MRRILITGSGARVGAVIARAFAARGWQPVLHYNTSAEAAERLAEELDTIALGADLSDLAAAERLVSRAAEALGAPLDGLVNNASIFEHDRPGDVTPPRLLEQYTVNTAAPVLLGKAFAATATPTAAAAAEGDPVIVNILDQKLWAPHPDHFSYTLSKAALETATLLMARDFAPTVRVLGVAPGYNLPSPGESEDAFRTKADKVNALQRRLHPEDVAAVVALAIEARALTGQVLYADNGEHLVPADRDVVFRDNSP